MESKTEKIDSDWLMFFTVRGLLPPQLRYWLAIKVSALSLSPCNAFKVVRKKKPKHTKISLQKFVESFKSELKSLVFVVQTESTSWHFKNVNCRHLNLKMAMALLILKIFVVRIPRILDWAKGKWIPVSSKQTKVINLRLARSSICITETRKVSSSPWSVTTYSDKCYN